MFRCNSIFFLRHYSVLVEGLGFLCMDALLVLRVIAERDNSCLAFLISTLCKQLRSCRPDGSFLLTSGSAGTTLITIPIPPTKSTHLRTLFCEFGNPQRIPMLYAVFKCSSHFSGEQCPQCLIEIVLSRRPLEAWCAVIESVNK